jgi:hypothetical protein
MPHDVADTPLHSSLFLNIMESPTSSQLFVTAKGELFKLSSDSGDFGA